MLTIGLITMMVLMVMIKNIMVLIIGNHTKVSVMIMIWMMSGMKKMMLVVVAAAVGKEVLDWLSNMRAVKAGLMPTHGVEFLDALATCAGGAVPLLARMI